MAQCPAHSRCSPVLVLAYALLYMFTRATSWSVKGRVSRGHASQAPSHMLAPLPHPHPLLHSLIQEGQSQEIQLPRTSFRGGGLPVQVSAQLTGGITHGGMWAPSLHLIGRPTLLPAFPLPQDSAPPRLHCCSASSPCPLFPLQETPTKSETHQKPLSNPNSPTGGREWGTPAPRQVQATPLPAHSGLPTATHFLFSLGLASR